MTDQTEEESKLKRITTRSIFEDLLDILNLKRGAPYTLWQTLLNPGKTIYTYLRVDRSRLINSFRLLVLIVTISTFITIKLNLTEIAFKDNVSISVDGNEALTQEEVMLKTKDIFNSYLSLFSFLLVPILGVFTYWFFKRSGHNVA
jgi:membrane protein insertase Oxa1/YidC/SpoIIIJ